MSALTLEITAAKAAVRAAMRRRRAALTPEMTAPAGMSAQTGVLRLPEWGVARCVCCYLAAPDEMPTGALLEDCRRVGREVCVPAFCRRRQAYFPAWLPATADMVAGYGGIAEPRAPQWVPASARVDLVVTPGLAFDRAGVRLGHGRGHYDRLLTQAGLRAGLKVGLAFEFQVVEKLPACDWDVRMDLVVTELGVYRNNGG